VLPILPITCVQQVLPEATVGIVGPVAHASGFGCWCEALVNLPPHTDRTAPKTPSLRRL